MAYNKTPKLCLGTLFSLLGVARKGGLSKNEKRTSGTDGLNDPSMLEALIKVFNYSLVFAAQETKTNDTSKIKNCKKDGTEWLPLGESIFVESIKNDFENDYYSLLKRTNLFIKDFLDFENEFKIKRIFKAILETIIEDSSISDDSVFYIGSNKTAIKKSDINKQVKYSYQSFLLGVLYYVLTSGIKNRDGEATIDEWFNSDSPHDPNKRFETEIGNGDCVKLTTFVLLSESDDQFKIKSEQEKELLTQEKDYSSYLEAVKQKYSKVITLLYEQPQSFDKLFVCSNLLCDMFSIGRVDMQPDVFLTQRVMKNPSVRKLLLLLSNRILISGTGGLGKSMMMRHLLLKSCADYPATKMLPFLVSLRNYNEEKDLASFVYNSTLPLHNMSFEEFKQILASGQAIILFDGMDEIQSNRQRSFELSLEEFTDRYSSNMFIISSRRFKRFDALSRFVFVSLMPLEQEQAVALINKLDFDNEKKVGFIKQLETKLFKTHKEFASNPLLLTILLLTFNSNAEIPLKMHVFYSKAYEALATRHDSNKGGFIREYRTRLSPDRFREYFTRFCALSYFEEKYEFDKEEYYKIFEEMKKEIEEPNENFTATEFLEDMLSAVCVLYEEENKYHFVHRSFQEYFTACFLCRADNNLYYPEICSFFNSDRDALKGDSTFDMFYDMDSKKVKEYLFLPYLKSIFEPEDADELEDNFHYFLRRMYPEINVAVGDSEQITEDYGPAPSEFVYSFIKKTLNIGDPNLFNIPIDDYFIEETYCSIKTNDFGQDMNVIYTINEGRAYAEEEGIDPDSIEESGWDISINTDYLLDNKDLHKEVYEYITNTSGDLYTEYIKLQSFYEELKQQKESKPIGLKKLFH